MNAKHGVQQWKERGKRKGIILHRSDHERRVRWELRVVQMLDFSIRFVHVVLFACILVAVIPFLLSLYLRGDTLISFLLAKMQPL